MSDACSPSPATTRLRWLAAALQEASRTSRGHPATSTTHNMKLKDATGAPSPPAPFLERAVKQLVGCHQRRAVLRILARAAMQPDESSVRSRRQSRVVGNAEEGHNSSTCARNGNERARMFERESGPNSEGFDCSARCAGTSGSADAGLGCLQCNWRCHRGARPLSLIGRRRRPHGSSFTS